VISRQADSVFTLLDQRDYKPLLLSETFMTVYHIGGDLQP
jgi:hypothetical protein